MLDPFASLLGTVMRVSGFLTDQIGNLWCLLLFDSLNEMVLCPLSARAVNDSLYLCVDE
jgi:hypothetical protein